MSFMSDVSDKVPSDKVPSMTGYRRSGKSCKNDHIVADTLGSNSSDNNSHTLSAIVKSITATAIARSPNAATREPVNITQCSSRLYIFLSRNLGKSLAVAVRALR